MAEEIDEKPGKNRFRRKIEEGLIPPEEGDVLQQLLHQHLIGSLQVVEARLHLVVGLLQRVHGRIQPLELLGLLRHL